MLKLRILTAIVLIGALSGVLLLTPPWVFTAIVTVAIAAASYEFARLVFPVDVWYRVATVGFAVGIAILLQWPASAMPFPGFLFGAIFGVSILHMARSTTLERFVTRVGATCFGAIYIGGGLAYLGLLRAADHGRALVVMTIGMAALADTFAYLFGRTVGRHKLAPLVSPNKTVEGFVAGFAGSVTAALLCRRWMWPDLPLWPVVGLGLIIGAIAPLGDLIESAMKRAYHVKDSGGMLPGHGGMLDRADAYIASAPAVFYYCKYVMGVI
ncbi:MAG: phosphatidate cytidylyltransferase [Deltaproteobacteria bacterium]|nr:phosphatidate cytidylyltransferase [Deltaproteobacteria bacterium]